MKNALGNLEKKNTECILKKIFIKFGEFMNKIFKNQKLDEILDLKSDINNTSKTKKKKKSKRKTTDDLTVSTGQVSVFDFHKPNQNSLTSCASNLTLFNTQYIPSIPTKQYRGKDDYIEIISLEDEPYDMSTLKTSPHILNCNFISKERDDSEETTQEDSGYT